jgi:hypothetical protein
MRFCRQKPPQCAALLLAFALILVWGINCSGQKRGVHDPLLSS